MVARETESKSKHLVVLSDHGFERLNAHSFMKGLLKEGKNLHCIDVDYGPLLRVKTCVAYSANGSKEVRFMTVGLSLQYSDISFVLSSDGQEVRPSAGQLPGIDHLTPLRALGVQEGSAGAPH